MVSLRSGCVSNGWRKPFRNHCETWYRDISGKVTWYPGSQWPFNIAPRHFSKNLHGLSYRRRLSVVSLGIHRELIDQAIVPGVAITTPHAMAVESMLSFSIGEHLA